MPTPIDQFNGSFSTAAAAITSTSAYVLVDTIIVPPGLRGRPMILSGVVGAGGALNGLRYTEAVTPGGTHATIQTDADFNTPTALMPMTSYTGANPPFTTAAGGSFTLRFASAPAEFAFYAKMASTNTTLAINGTLLR